MITEGVIGWIIWKYKIIKRTEGKTITFPKQNQVNSVEW